MDRFSCKTEVISGQGAIGVLEEEKGMRFVVVTAPEGRSLSPQMDRLLRCRERICMADACPEPSVRQAVDGARRLREVRPDGVIAIGGENVLDFAKAIRCFSGEPCFLTVVPTVIGTGTEVTDTVTLVHDGRRHLLRDGAMRPDRAVLDGSLLEERSQREWASGGFALLAAGVECYCAKRGGVVGDLLAREVFTSVWAMLPATVAGNAGARQRLQLASAMAGMAREQGGTGLCGALCGSLSSLLHLPPEKLAPMVLPAVIGCGGHGAGARYAELARAAGLGGSSNGAGAGNLRSGLLRLRRELDLPATLAQAGIDPRRVWDSAGEIVRMTLEDQHCRNGPLVADDFTVRRILQEITGCL